MKSDKQRLKLKISDLIPTDVWQYAVLYSYLLFFPPMLMSFLNKCTNMSEIFIEKLFMLICFILFSAIGSHWCRKIIILAQITAAVIWNCIDLFCFIQLKTQILPSFFLLLNSTNLHECSSFLNIYIPHLSNLMLLLYPGIGFSVFYLFPKHRLWLLPLLLITVIPTTSAIFRLEGSYNKNIQSLYELFDSTANEILENDLNEKIVVLANSDLNAICKEQEMVAIFVIGESHSKARSQLYGYPRATNPRLSQRRKDGKLAVFTDVVSPHSFTIYSIPKLLTFAAHDQAQNFSQLPNIFDLARSAGFKTFWLCNHTPISDRAMPYSIVTSRADIIAHTSPANQQLPDGVLLPVYKTALKDPAKKKLIVLQLIGNHHDYKGTYPESFRFFPLDSKPDFFNTEQKKHAVLMNHYDNSIRYNDHILNEIICELEKTGKPGFMLYVPDHGENLFEQPGMLLHMEFMPTIQSVEIPMYLHIQSNHPDISKIYEDVYSRPFASEDTPFLLLDLAKIHYSKADMRKSIFSADFVQKKRIVSKCSVDYNKLKSFGGHGYLDNKELH